MKFGEPAVIQMDGLERLIQLLWADGYEVVGPQARDGAIVYDTLRSADELPRGVGDEQQPGHYRLRERGDNAVFGHAVGPHTLKRFLHPPLVTLWRARRSALGFELEGEAAEPPRFAFVGVRPCEVAAIAVLDRVLLGEPADAVYAARRRGALVVAVSCSDPAGTCFCGSMGCGPHATAGFDIALTELAGDAPRFVLECGSERGAGLASRLGATPAADADLEAAVLVHARAEAALTRQLELPGLKQLLEQRYDDPLWDEVARRCLACGNCTLVCPTCFCTAIDDVTDLSGCQAERRRRADTCFGVEFSYIHGGSVRTSTAARYRQWLTHKLAAWQDQFGTPGCVVKSSISSFSKKPADEVTCEPKLSFNVVVLATAFPAASTTEKCVVCGPSPRLTMVFGGTEALAA